MTIFYQTVARYYDAETGGKTDDLLMYSRLAASYGAPILDVGCGTGRVLLHLAQEGYAGHGMDTSGEMLNRLANKLNGLPHLREYITTTEGDILTDAPEQQFALTLLSYNALMHFHYQPIQLDLLRRLHALTKPDGLLVIDLPNAGESFATADSDSLLLDRTFIDPETGHMVMLQSISYLDRTTQLMQVQWLYDEITEDGTVKRLFVPHVLRYFFLSEMQLLLAQTGFSVEAVYGSTDEDPYEDGSERMIIYASPAL